MNKGLMYFNYYVHNNDLYRKLAVSSKGKLAAQQNHTELSPNTNILYETSCVFVTLIGVGVRLIPDVFSCCLTLEREGISGVERDNFSTEAIEGFVMTGNG